MAALEGITSADLDREQVAMLWNGTSSLDSRRDHSRLFLLVFKNNRLPVDLTECPVSTGSGSNL